MKETNSLESQLNSWKPRRPSAKIKRRLFPASSARVELVRVLNWLAPATVCMLMAVAAFRQETSFPSSSTRPDPLVAMMLSNASSVPYLTGGQSQIAENVLPGTFELTNRSPSTSTVGFTPFKKPNE